MLYPSGEPIQVHPNDSGPINPKPRSGGRYAYVSYIDPETDAGLYGYGDTPIDAATSYITNMAEELCYSCTEDECPTANDCILVEPNFSAFIRQHMPASLLEDDDTSHRTWRELNPLPSFNPFLNPPNPESK